MENTEENLFVSVRGRVLINVEALNMAESVGNYVKHRRVPVISPVTYATYFVPAISGESIAHGYQKALVEEAKNNEEFKNKICNLCKEGIFLKSTNNKVILDAFDITNWEINSEADLERAIISNCIVEDIGGFLYAPGQEKLEKDEKEKLKNAGLLDDKGSKFGNVKRTSNFFTGYMIPAQEALDSVIIEPQLHSRYALGTPFVGKGAQGQMIYYVELSSAPYVFSFDLDTKYINKLTFHYKSAGELAQEGGNERQARIEISLDSLKNFLIDMMFGAKKTRFLPIVDWESLVIAISDDIWTISSPLTANYIMNTLKKLDKINNKTELFVYINPAIFEGSTTSITQKYKGVKDELGKKEKEEVIHLYEHFEECVIESIKRAKERVKSREKGKG